MVWQSIQSLVACLISRPHVPFIVFFVMQHSQCLKSFPLHGLWLISQMLMEVILMVQYKVWGVEKRFISEWDKVPACRNLTIMWVGPLWLARVVSMEKVSFQFEMKWGESSKYQESGSVESDFFFFKQRCPFLNCRHSAYGFIDFFIFFCNLLCPNP